MWTLRHDWYGLEQFTKQDTMKKKLNKVLMCQMVGNLKIQQNLPNPLTYTIWGGTDARTSIKWNINSANMLLKISFKTEHNKVCAHWVCSLSWPYSQSTSISNLICSENVEATISQQSTWIGICQFLEQPFVKLYQGGYTVITYEVTSLPLLQLEQNMFTPDHQDRFKPSSKSHLVIH